MLPVLCYLLLTSIINLSGCNWLSNSCSSFPQITWLLCQSIILLFSFQCRWIVRRISSSFIGSVRHLYVEPALIMLLETSLPWYRTCFLVWHCVIVLSLKCIWIELLLLGLELEGRFISCWSIIGVTSLGQICLLALSWYWIWSTASISDIWALITAIQILIPSRRDLLFRTIHRRGLSPKCTQLLSLVLCSTRYNRVILLLRILKVTPCRIIVHLFILIILHLLLWQWCLYLLLVSAARVILVAYSILFLLFVLSLKCNWHFVLPI